MNHTRLALALGAAALAITPAAAQAQKPPKPPKAPKGGKLTLAATPNPVKYGSTVTLSGKLTGPATGAQAVTVQSDPHPFGVFKAFATATTTAAGDYSLRVKPLKNTRYRTTKGPELSGVADVLVRPRISLRLSDYTPKRGQRVRFAGRVCPQHDGRTLHIQRRTSTGYRTVRRTALRDIAGSTCSRYARTFRVYRDGRVCPQHDGRTLSIQRRTSTGYRTVRRTALRDIPGSTCSRYARTFRVYRDGRYRAAIARHGDHFTGYSASRVANAHR